MSYIWYYKKQMPQTVQLIEAIERRKAAFAMARFVILNPEDWKTLYQLLGLQYGSNIIDGAYAVCDLQVMTDPNLDRGVIVVR